MPNYTPLKLSFVNKKCISQPNNKKGDINHLICKVKYLCLLTIIRIQEILAQ